MKPFQKSALYFSLAVILVYWIYQWSVLNSHSDLPATFSEFTLLIIRNKFITFSVIFILLKLQGQGWRDVGLSRPFLKPFLRGLLYGVILFILINVILTSVMDSVFPPVEKSDSGIMAFFKDTRNLLTWLLIGIIGGGFVEEFQRIFILTRFQEWLGKSGIVIALALTSFFFGLGHLYQGIGAAISTGIGGLCLGLIYLRNGSALEAITAHAFSDVLAILAATFLVK